VTALKLHDCRTVSAQPPYGFVLISSPRVHTKYRTIIMYYVNTYAVARSHIRCPKKPYGKSQTKLSHGVRGKCKLGLISNFFYLFDTQDDVTSCYLMLCTHIMYIMASMQTVWITYQKWKQQLVIDKFLFRINGKGRYPNFHNWICPGTMQTDSQQIVNTKNVMNPPDHRHDIAALIAVTDAILCHLMLA